MQIIQKKIDELIPYENNTKKHDDTQIRNVAESIKQYGFVQPLVIDKDNVIVIGHCRYEASKTLGMEEVPCVLVDNLTEEQVKALRLVDNKTNESEWDMDALLEEIDGVDLDGFDQLFTLNEFNLEDISYIDDLMENDFGSKDESKEYFSATIILPISISEKFKKVNNKQEGKQEIVTAIVETVTGYEL